MATKKKIEKETKKTVKPKAKKPARIAMQSVAGGEVAPKAVKKVKEAKDAKEIKEIKEVKEVEAVKEVKEKEVESVKEKKGFSGKYFYAVGRRKSSVAQVRLYKDEKAGDNDYIINNKKAKEYFPGVSLQNVLFAPFKAVGTHGKFKFTILVRGGGFRGQVEATQLGIARALVKSDETLRKALKDLKFLTRDSRKVERKKPGLKRARRAPQWQKR
jgi:small subunit ribosomal protein S9